MKKAIGALVLSLALFLSEAAHAASADDAQAAFNRGDYALSLDILQPLAEAGDPKAQVFLSSHYAWGLGVPMDTAEAIGWLTQAADQGYADGILGLGMLYASTPDKAFQDYGKAREWLERGDAVGNLPSTAFLGMLYLYGWGVPVDETRAVAYFTKGAEAGYAQAQRLLGVLYHGGRGVTEDHAEAARLFALAAEQNDAGAQVRFAIVLFEGDHVAQDYVEAGKWALLSATQGDKDAREFMEDLTIS